MSNSVKLLSDMYEAIVLSAAPRGIDMTLDISADGNSAFVDIFGETRSARFTIYKDGIGDCEIISEESNYSYMNIKDLYTEEDIWRTLIELIEKVKSR